VAWGPGAHPLAQRMHALSALPKPSLRRHSRLASTSGLIPASLHPQVLLQSLSPEALDEAAAAVPGLVSGLLANVLAWRALTPAQLAGPASSAPLRALLAAAAPLARRLRGPGARAAAEAALSVVAAAGLPVPAGSGWGAGVAARGSAASGRGVEELVIALSDAASCFRGDAAACKVRGSRVAMPRYALLAARAGWC
jgi:hypothetical protein